MHVLIQLRRQKNKQNKRLKKTKQKTQKDKKVKHRKLNEESILVPNTYVVHKFHGIGLYEGTEVKKIKDVDKDYLSIKFGGTDRLYVPSDQINELEVYVGGENPRLSRLGGGEWERAKEKARQNAKVIADRVLNLYKLRKIEKMMKNDEHKNRNEENKETLTKNDEQK